MIYLDLETTGLLLPPQADPARQPRIVQAAWAEDDLDIKTIISDPGIPIPHEVSRIHGITDAVVRGCIGASTLILLMLEKFKGRAVCAYNAGFDLTVIEHECRRFGLAPTWSSVCDPMLMAEDRFGTRFKLVDLHEKLFGYRPAKAHDAAADVESLRRVHKALTVMA